MGLQFKADSSASHKVDSDEMAAAIGRVLKACQKNNVIPGIVTATAEDAARRIKQGFRLVTCMNGLGFFCSRTKQRIQNVRELANQPCPLSQNGISNTLMEVRNMSMIESNNWNNLPWRHLHPGSEQAVIATGADSMTVTIHQVRHLP